MTAELDRRHALAGAAAVAVGVPLLSSCGDSTDSASDPSSQPDATSTGSSAPSGSGKPEALASTSEVPVGGCLVVSQVVLTQPSEGDFKAFSATCTHQGCTVSQGNDGFIPCRCHGSQFSLEDGSVLQGPATSALAEVGIEIDGESIALA